MNCACCGRKKKMFESFEDLGKGGCVCVQCSDIMYRIHDAVTEKNKGIYSEQVAIIRSFGEKKKSTSEFIKWFEEDFMKRNEFKESK